MFEDDNLPRNAKPAVKKLDDMSIAELERYIADMKAEIIRVEQEIVRKKAHAEAASSLFKK